MFTDKKPFYIRITALLTVIITALSFFAAPVYAAEKYPQVKNSHLTGLDALFCGDSICAAEFYDSKGQTYWGWAKRIGAAYGLNTAVNAGADSASVSDVRGDNTVVNQLKANGGKEFDIVVLEGGTNDGWFRAPAGKCTADSCRSHKDFDVSTYAGGLEDLFLTARELFPDAVVCYFTTYRTPSARGYLSDMSAYYTAAIQICEKWDIPCLDLYFSEEFNKIWLPGTYTVDNIHPNGDGYDVLYTYIGEFIDKAVAESSVPDFVYGDTDADGEVTPADARLTLRASLRLENFEKGSKAYLASDVDLDNELSPEDARLILRFSVGLESGLGIKK